jgi:hypothetical protein
MNKNFPQSDATELYERFDNEKLRVISKYGCCAFTALWIMGITDSINAITILADEIGKGLDNECTVQWFDFFKNVSGRSIKVEFRDIKKLIDLGSVKGRCAVRYDFNGKNHWVGVENGKIAFNSLKTSQCVTLGKPTKARIITFL